MRVFGSAGMRTGSAVTLRLLVEDGIRGIGGSLSLLRVRGPVARDVELEDDGVVDKAVDRRGGRERILEDPLPLVEHGIARDQHRTPLVAFGEQGEEDFRLLGALADVAEVIQDDQGEGVELVEEPGEHEIALGGEELLDELVRAGEAHGVARLNERVPEHRGGVTLARAGQPEHEDVDRALEELPRGEGAELLAERPREAPLVERRERLPGREFRGGPQPGDAVSCLSWASSSKTSSRIASESSWPASSKRRTTPARTVGRWNWRQSASDRSRWLGEKPAAVIGPPARRAAHRRR